MDTKVISTGVRYTSLPDSYVRPEADRPKLSEVQNCDDVPIIDLGSEDRTSIVQQKGICHACLLYGFFQVINHGVSMEEAERMQEVAHEFFQLPLEEKMKLYSDDPAKTMRLLTSFNVKKQTELGKQQEQLENQQERLGRQSEELPWSTENPAVVLATIAALIALAAVKFQKASENPFDSCPVTMAFIVIALLIYGFAATRTRPITLDGKQQQILRWRFIYNCYRLLNSLVLISRVVCQACIVSLFFTPNGPEWNVYVACASTCCFGVAVWAILRNFAPSCVAQLVPCMDLTGSSGGSEKNDGVSDCGKDGRNGIAESNRSPVCGSSLVSENQSNFQQGGTSSSDTGSHSGHCKAEQSQLKHTCEHGVPSHQTDHSTQANGKTASTGDRVSPHIIQSSLNKGTMLKAHPDPDEKPIQSPNPLKAARGQGLDMPSLSQRPCVSTRASYKPFDHPLDV